jgi:hypothetical protein
LIKSLINNRNLIERDLAASLDRWYLTPVTFAQYQLSSKVINKYAFGKLIDIGCGDMPYNRFFSSKVKSYTGLDKYPRSTRVKYQVDIQDSSSLPDAIFNTALCMEVLEHLPTPWLALNNINKILDKRGFLILSVPLLSRLHDIPHDYFRFTEYGLKSLLSSAGFEIITIIRKGSWVSFLGHQLSTLLVSLTWKIWLIKNITWWINKYCIVIPIFFIDKVINKSGFLPQGYILVARKLDSRKK